MRTVTTEINGQTFNLATTLRVAYNVQGQHNHKPYVEIFQDIGNMPIEQQINILFAAFEVANPEVAKTFNKGSFLNYYLDNFDLSVVMDQLQGVVKGILGEDDKTAEDEETEGESTGDGGNL